MKPSIQSGRREFLKNSSKFAATLSLLSGGALIPSPQSSRTDELEVHIFSKHLQFLDFENMASAAADLGFDGVELTVRNKGHVLPEQVEKDLPKAVEAIKKKNLKANMMVSGLNSVNPLNQKVLETAAAHGIEYYRLGYFRYPKEGGLPSAMKSFNDDMQELEKLNRKLGIKGSYQNHAGGAVGAAIWEVWQLLQGTSVEYMGSQYDIRHAVVEGGLSWKNGLRLIKDHIHSLVMKDFRWVKQDGKWRVLNTPLGEGMVDFEEYFRQLKAYKIQVPVSIHYEYDLFGANHGERNIASMDQKKVLAAMRKDLEWLRKTWANA